MLPDTDDGLTTNLPEWVRTDFQAVLPRLQNVYATSEGGRMLIDAHAQLATALDQMASDLTDSRPRTATAETATARAATSPEEQQRLIALAAAIIIKRCLGRG